MERAIRIERAWLCAVREMRDLDLIPGVIRLLNSLTDGLGRLLGI